MEAEVELETVEREVRAQGVRRRPADVLTDVLGPGGQELRDERDHDVAERDESEGLDGDAADRAVDEVPQELRSHELESDAHEEKRRQERGAPPLWPDVGAEQLDIAALESHGVSLAEAL